MLPYPFKMPLIRYVAQWQPYRDNDPALQWFRGKLRDTAARIDGSG